MPRTYEGAGPSDSSLSVLVLGPKEMNVMSRLTEHREPVFIHRCFAHRLHVFVVHFAHTW